MKDFYFILFLFLRKKKRLLAFISAICLFILTLNNCFAGTPQGYAAIWRAENDNDRKTAAVACFDAVVASKYNSSKCNKNNALKHLLLREYWAEA